MCAGILVRFEGGGLGDGVLVERAVSFSRIQKHQLVNISESEPQIQWVTRI